MTILGSPFISPENCGLVDSSNVCLPTSRSVQKSLSSYSTYYSLSPSAPVLGQRRNERGSDFVSSSLLLLVHQLSIRTKDCCPSDTTTKTITLPSPVTSIVWRLQKNGCNILVPSLQQHVGDSLFEINFIILPSRITQQRLINSTSSNEIAIYIY